jgi:putative ABC transport system ATP-binding protein/macrolide transport system ATP-binding/permease protein/lipoprotein-releasing system ATP-binding protein
MLAVEGIGKRFLSERPVEAVRETSFTLERGRFLAIVGRSGSGKSTLLGMLGGISRPTAGSVVVNGIDQWLLDDSTRAGFRNRNIGFVFQFASLLPSLRAIDNVALPALIGGVLNYKEAYARAHALLDSLGLAERFDAYPGQLSGGEQRRVAIARALINSPPLLLADEPTADLDEETENEILKQLVEIHCTLNLTLVVVTHNSAIAALADQLIEMRAGNAVNCLEHKSANVGNAAGGNGNGEQVRRIFETPSQQIAVEPVRLGEGFEKFVGRLVLFVVPLLALVWVINTAVASYQRSVIEAKIAQRQALEELAMKGLRADVKNISFGPGKTYLVNFYMRNTRGDQPIYVMSPTVRAFIQIGSSWQEVPFKPVSSSRPAVTKIIGNQVDSYVLKPNVHEFEQLLPYYMHVRFSVEMLVSPSSQPKDDLIERSDNYYVYLKPHDADDAAILSKLKFPGKPPIWIPMPPH